MRTKADSPTKTCTEPDCEDALRARGLCSTHYNRRYQPNRHAVAPTRCSICSVPIVRPISTGRRPVCSVECRSALSGHDGSSTDYTWATDAAQRARAAGAVVVELFDREQVFERDGWTCQRCGQAVSLEVDALDPNSATVDHVIPLSRGGEHTVANAQCLCLRCNSIKGDR